MEPGLQAALGSDDPASRSVEDGSQEAAAAAMSAGAAVGWRSGPALRPCPPLRGVVASQSLPSPSPRGSRWPGAGQWRGATLPPVRLPAELACGCRRRMR
ncbi:hypothetical protein PVAP13_2KG176916 [Panicum virgatum]|uniref:Uncharacterized protein n=1 Tax=Panicum virgatum TaxID=38727 RepID=A0A8T0W1T0_PANVG|nr:hypothetical protein PVAP13_2KG176916 [Panicum virgatum]